jgi:hypothetical protein
METICDNSQASSLTSLDQKIEEANLLHSLVVKSMDYAVRLGKILTEIKASLPYGEWLPWFKQGKLQFSQQSASNYMRIYAAKQNGRLPETGNLTQDGVLKSLRTSSDDSPEAKERVRLHSTTPENVDEFDHRADEVIPKVIKGLLSEFTDIYHRRLIQKLADYINEEFYSPELSTRP